MNTLLQKNDNYDSDEKKVAKSLHGRGIKPETFRAADAHATSTAASMELFMERLHQD